MGRIIPINLDPKKWRIQVNLEARRDTLFVFLLNPNKDSTGLSYKIGIWAQDGETFFQKDLDKLISLEMDTIAWATPWLTIIWAPSWATWTIVSIVWTTLIISPISWIFLIWDTVTWTWYSGVIQTDPFESWAQLTLTKNTLMNDWEEIPKWCFLYTIKECVEATWWDWTIMFEWEFIVLDEITNC